MLWMVSKVAPRSPLNIGYVKLDGPITFLEKNSHFTLKNGLFYPKFGLFGSITRKPLVRKCCEWSQKLLLGPLSTLVKMNWRISSMSLIGQKSRAKLMEIRKTIFLPSTKKNLRTSFWNCFFLMKWREHSYIKSK